MTQYSVNTIGNVPVVTLGTATLEAGLCREIERGVEKSLLSGSRAVLDLGVLSYFDSTGLGVIVGWIEKCRHAGVDIRLCNPTRSSCALFELAQVVDLAPIFDSRDEALASFARESRPANPVRMMTAGRAPA